MSELHALYRVQELELDILARAERIKAINVEMAGDEELAAARETHEAALAAHQEAARRATEHEHEIRALVDRRASSEEQLYSGAISNPREQQDLQLAIEAMSRRKTNLDDEMLHLILARDELSERLEESQARLDELSAARAEANVELQKEKDALSRVVNEMLAERKQQVSEIAPDLFQNYQQMRAAKGNRPLAVLSDNACASCGIEQNVVVINAISRSNDIVHCQNCGRILLRL